MRKNTAITLLTVFALYHLGYYLIYTSLRQQRDIFWEKKLVSNDLSGEHVLQRALPITFPYQPDQEDLLNLKLEREIDGQVYRVLKYRYEKDTLHITYVKDIHEEGLNRSFSDWASSFTQKPASEKGGSKQIMAFEKNYLPHYENFNLQNSSGLTRKKFQIYLRSELSSFLEVAVPPPRNISIA